MPSASPSGANPTAAATAPESATRAAPGGKGDTPEAARGRRILSTAFVQIGPDGHLTVELRDGRALVLRDVTMQAADYCGTLASGARHCGGYADVAAARPGPAVVPDAVSTAAGPVPAAIERR